MRLTLRNVSKLSHHQELYMILIKDINRNASITSFVWWHYPRLFIPYFKFVTVGSLDHEEGFRRCNRHCVIARKLSLVVSVSEIFSQRITFSWHNMGKKTTPKKTTMKKKKTTNSLTSCKRQSLNISQKEAAAISYVICRAQSFPYRESHFIKPNICLYRKKSTHPAAIWSRPLVFLVNKLTALAHHQNRFCRTCVILSDAPSGILGICEGALCGAKCSLRCNCVSLVVVVVVKIEAGRRLCFGMVLCRWESVLFMSQLRKVLRVFGSCGAVF